MVGDVVEWCGVRGEVLQTDSAFGPGALIPGAPGDSLQVKFPDNRTAYFTEDGAYFHWHKEPSLKLIERPKKKVKKVMYPVITKNEYGRWFLTQTMFENEEQARKVFDDFIALGPAVEFEAEE